MNTFLKTNHQLKRWLPSLKVLTLATSMTVGLAVSESVWAGCIETGSGFYCDMNSATYSTEVACLAACVSAPTTYTLTLNTTGTGTGTVSGGGTYPKGIKVDLVATPAADSTFAGWSSGCSSGMTLMANTTCTATFNKGDSTTPTTTPTTSFTPPLPEYMSIFLQVAGTGQGKVTTDTGLFCQSSDCQVDPKTGDLKCYPQNCTQLEKTASYVTLTPVADADSVFSSWGGNEDCVDGQVLINGGKLCIAYFHRLYELTVTVDGPGIVTGKTLGYGSKTPINCGQGQTQCNNTYESAIKDTLQAQPLGNAIFLGWSGDCRSSFSDFVYIPNIASLNSDKDMTCEALFVEPITNPITIEGTENPTITNISPATSEVVGDQVTSTATGGASNNPVTLTTQDLCTVDASGQVTFNAAGTCTVTADPTVTANIQVNAPVVKKDQVITNFAPTNYVLVEKAMVGDKPTLTAKGGASDNPVTYTSTTPTICTVSEKTVNLVAVGTCIITADQAGNDQYNPASPVTTAIKVNQPVETTAPTTSNWSLVTTSTVGNSLTLTATGDTSVNPVTFTSTTPTVCTVSGNTVSFIAEGICTVTANQAGSATSTVVATVTVNPVPAATTVTTSPTVTEQLVSLPVPGCPGITEENGVYIVSASCNTNGHIFDELVVVKRGVSLSNATFNNTVDNQGFLSNITIGEQGELKGGKLSGSVKNQGNVCNVSFVGSSFVGGTVCGKIQNNSKVGACLEDVTALLGTEITGCVEKKNQDITFVPDATGTTSATPAAKKDQTISFDEALPTTAEVGFLQFIQVTASSGLVVDLVSDTPQVCELLGSAAVTFLTAGKCTIIAGQAGNDQYKEATPVSLDIMVEKSAITFSQPSSGKVGQQATLIATSSESDNPITFASVTTKVCTVKGTQITFVAVGDCIVDATQTNPTAQGSTKIAVTTDLPAIPRVTQLNIVSLTSDDNNLRTDKVSVCPNGTEALTAGIEGTKVTIWALQELQAQDRNLNDPNNCLGNRGLVKEDTANGRVVLKLVSVANRTEYKRFPAVDMLNGEAQVVFPADVTMAGNYYLEAELYLAVNGDEDPNKDMALPNIIDNVDMFTADIMEVSATGKPKKLKLSSTKRVISDDANGNAATQIRVEALDEYGNLTALPQGTPTKVKVEDAANVLNTTTLNLDFASGGQANGNDYIGDSHGDVLKLGETSLVATIENFPGIAASDPLKIKVVADNLVAAPYVGSLVADDVAYGDVAGIPAGDAPYPSANRYYPNTPNVVKDIQVGQAVKAFSVGVDGVRGIPDGLFDFYRSSSDNQILSNLVGRGDDFVSKNGPVVLTIRTPAGETVKATLAKLDARAEVLFTKSVSKKEGDYFIISDEAGQYGETLVYLPGDIKPSAASKAEILNAHGFEDVELDKHGNSVLDENGYPIIALDAELDYPELTGGHQLVIPESSIKLGDKYGNAVDSSDSVVPSTEHGTVELVSFDETGMPILGSTRTVRADADNTASAYVISYDKDFVGTDKIILNFANPDIKPRTIEVKIPREPRLSTIQVQSPQTTLPTGSEVTITVSSLDERGILMDALENTTVSFSGTILDTASIVRAEEENRDEAGNLITTPLKSGSIVRSDGGDQQVLILNTGDQEGELTLTFNNPELPEGTPPPTISFEVIAGKSAAQETCENQGGIFAKSQCFSVMNAEHKPTGLVAGLGAASTADNGWYGDDLTKENAAFFGGIMLTDTQGIGDRNIQQFQSTATILQGDEIHLAGIIKVEEEDKGQPANLVVGVLQTYPAGLVWYILVECSEDDMVSIPTCSALGWKAKTWPHDATGYPILSLLEPLKPVTLGGTPNDGQETYVTVDIFKGNFTFDMDSIIRVYFGYMMTAGDKAGKIVYGEKPIEAQIEPTATVK